MQEAGRSDGDGRFRMRVAERALPPLPGRRSRIFLRWFARVSLGLMAALVLLVVTVPLLIDWNAFRPQIVAAARDATGREVALEAIEVAFQPQPTVVLKELGLANPGGTGDGWLMRVPEARVGLRLLPLLSRELIVEEVQIRQPSIRLRVDGEGAPNWRLGQGEAAPPRAGGGERAAPFDLVGVKGIAVEGGRLEYQDASSEERVEARGFELEGELDVRGTSIEALLASLEASFDLRLAAIETSDLPVARVADLEGTFTVPPEDGSISIALRAMATGRQAGQAIPVAVHGDIGRPQVLLASEEAYPIDLEARLGEVHAEISGTIRQPLAQPRPRLDLHLAGQSSGAVAALLGEELPELGPFEIGASLDVPSRQRIVLHALEARIASLTATAEGEIRDADGADPKPEFQIEVGGDTLAELRPVLGPGVPDVGPFEVKADVRAAGQKLTVENLDAKLADSDLAGRAEVTLGGVRPRVVATLSSDTIDLPELLGMPPESGEDAGDAPRQPAAAGDGRQRQLFPDDPLPLDLLQLIDAELAVEVAELRVEEDLRFTKTTLNLGLADGRLSLDPIESEVARGGIKGTLTLDGARRPATLQTTIDAQSIRLGDVLRQIELIDLGQAEATATVDLRTEGNSLREMASGLNGETFLSSKGGRVKLGALRILVAGLGDIVRPLLGGDQAVEINCFVNAYRIQDGIMTSQVQLFSTTAFGVAGAGEIDLRDETLDLHFTTEARQASLASLAVPFRVSGPITEPRARPTAVGTVFTAARVAGMVLDPVGMAAALIATGKNASDACEEALTRAQQGVPPQTRGNAVERTIESFGEDIKGLFGN